MLHLRTVESSALSVWTLQLWTLDTNQCQPLYLDIQEFYEGINMKVEQQVPLLLVERQALNEAMDGEKSQLLYCLRSLSSPASPPPSSTLRDGVFFRWTATGFSLDRRRLGFHPFNGGWLCSRSKATNRRRDWVVRDGELDFGQSVLAMEHCCNTVKVARQLQVVLSSSVVFLEL
ncbi:hypothetical protein Vadar_013154 [Vaccinium darrowii]|uniref:Uncharacterized protein n=1 Tax=Vaccinium darrowii TaxID=229202 RepID=A0ACB7X0N8_9ERIC|nr:hypothetical protein Vadar_013154 [Vaccinium darrowii]